MACLVETDVVRELEGAGNGRGGGAGPWAEGWGGRRWRFEGSDESVGDDAADDADGAAADDDADGAAADDDADDANGNNADDSDDVDDDEAAKAVHGRGALSATRWAAAVDAEHQALCPRGAMDDWRMGVMGKDGRRECRAQLFRGGVTAKTTSRPRQHHASASTTPDH
ncbi:hypothetical protein E4U53_002279 [Claviceps sorghi]|nr:hypothetical protein E4U53_002279 [Claviceps sorghi]